jgi:hypothetical protein
MEATRTGVAPCPIEGDKVVQDIDPETHDGDTMSKVILRRNLSRRDTHPTATAKVFRSGRFSPDNIDAWHPDDSIKLHERAKKIISREGEPQ